MRWRRVGLGTIGNLKVNLGVGCHGRNKKRNLFRLQCRVWKAIRAGDKARGNSLPKLILRSRSARLLAIRQVTQLNAGNKTAGVDGMKCLSFSQRLELEKLLKDRAKMMKDRAWQCLIEYVIEPAHEALFHERSYGFRPGRSTHDCQRLF